MRANDASIQEMRFASTQGFYQIPFTMVRPWDGKQAAGAFL